MTIRNINLDSGQETPTPEHDKIVFWLQSQAARICAAWYKTEVSDVKCIWEMPIVRREHKYGRTWEETAGYADIVVTCGHSPVQASICASHGELRAGGSECARYLSDNSMTPVWIDHSPGCTAEISREVQEKAGMLVFEVKPQIVSCGELLRQLARYRQILVSPIIVVSPDTAWRKIIREQGYGFINPRKKVPHWDRLE